MFNIALYEPEIPPNTGNIIRLCANTGCQLHLIHPLGFELDDTRLRRAGLDYQEYTKVRQHEDFAHFITGVDPARIFALSTKGKKGFFDMQYQEGDSFLFGPETRGLPENIREQLGSNQVLRMPMLPDSRSLNLSNTAAIVVYEAWRQLGFKGAI
ncbi:MAG: tRNA (uridine(34)/cytosine(34)/5-carboxymethylaminomethyluridine(34)-2'-O)-methyltransferase TrmL [Gammaproteobacteria bacterium]|jgi:tRNA (cytidine/uridine-2'-O-)-methyltransferase